MTTTNTGKTMKEFKITVLGQKHQQILSVQFVGTECKAKEKAEELLENNRSVIIEILGNSHFKMGRRRFSKIVKQNDSDTHWYGVTY